MNVLFYGLSLLSGSLAVLAYVTRHNTAKTSSGKTRCRNFVLLTAVLSIVFVTLPSLNQSNTAQAQADNNSKVVKTYKVTGVEHLNGGKTTVVKLNGGKYKVFTTKSINFNQRVSNKNSDTTLALTYHANEAPHYQYQLVEGNK